jgi:hypothetical protein
MFGSFDMSAQSNNSSSSNKLICKISPASFDQLTKILTTLEKSGTITIKDSKITQSINKGIAILHTDVHKLIGSGVNMHILSPEKAIRKFKLIKSNNDILVYDNEEMQRYEIRVEGLVVKLPKQIQEIEEEATLPTFEGVSNVGVPVLIDKNTAKMITGLMTGNEYVELMIHNDQFKGIYTTEATYILPQFNTEQISESNAQHMLKSHVFLPVDGEDFTVQIGKGMGKFWLSTRANTGYLAIDIYEEVIETSGENMLI